MIYIAIICALAFGAFEAAIFRNTEDEVDYTIAWLSFLSAGFLIVFKLSGAW